MGLIRNPSNYRPERAVYITKSLPLGCLVKRHAPSAMLIFRVELLRAFCPKKPFFRHLFRCVLRKSNYQSHGLICPFRAALIMQFICPRRCLWAELLWAFSPNSDVVFIYWCMFFENSIIKRKGNLFKTQTKIQIVVLYFFCNFNDMFSKSMNHINRNIVQIKTWNLLDNTIFF